VVYVIRDGIAAKWGQIGAFIKARKVVLGLINHISSWGRNIPPLKRCRKMLGC